jgi:hypothetical protein
MLLQVVIGASLETLEDFCIGSLDLAIALWVSNRRIANSVFLECAVGKLGPVVTDYSVRDPKPIDDRLDELDYGLLVDLDHRGCF